MRKAMNQISAFQTCWEIEIFWCFMKWGSRQTLEITLFFFFFFFFFSANKREKKRTTPIYIFFFFKNCIVRQLALCPIDSHWKWSLVSVSQHRWFSGRMLACHAGGPGSIPGRCNVFFYFCPLTKLRNITKNIKWTTLFNCQTKKINK